MIIVKRKINFYDCDPAGILFYANLFRICHSVYEEMISSFNLKENYWDNNVYLIPIIKTSGEFHQPVKSGDEITIHLYVSQLKSHSFELNYEWLNETGESVASAKTVHVIVDKETWKKKNINEDILKGLQRHQKN